MIERKKKAGGGIVVIMTECAICEKPLPPQARTADHIGGHSPGELGL